MKSDSKVALLEKHRTWIRQIRSSVSNTLESIPRSRQFSGIECCGLTKVDLTCSGPMAKLWAGERLKKHDPKCIVPTGKHGGENVKYWSCLSCSRVGNLIIIGRSIKEGIFRDILQKNLVESVKNLNLDQRWVMQHDNDPTHRAHTVTKWLNEKGVERLRWPSFSPDLNQIEYIWDEVEK